MVGHGAPLTIEALNTEPDLVVIQALGATRSRP